MIEVGALTSYVILLAVPIVAGLVGYGAYCYSNHSQQTIETSDRLLAQLCAVHHISFQHQVLLQSIAETANIVNPAVLFALPEEFDAAVNAAAESRSLDAWEQKAIGQLRRQMFA